jgi:glycerol-3-phosphate acyltransferase PlsY
MIPIGGIDVLIAVIMALIVIWCHRANIQRIQQGKESKLSFKSKKDGEGK